MTKLKQHSRISRPERVRLQNKSRLLKKKRQEHKKPEISPQKDLILIKKIKKPEMPMQQLLS